jgi:hypothetical protein
MELNVKSVPIVVEHNDIIVEQGVTEDNGEYTTKKYPYGTVLKIYPKQFPHLAQTLEVERDG